MAENVDFYWRKKQFSIRSCIRVFLMMVMKIAVSYNTPKLCKTKILFKHGVRSNELFQFSCKVLIS